MVKKVKAYIAEYNMLEAFDKIVIGVSGGADSICLLLVLLEIKKTIPLELLCVHVHHGMRGEEADRDASFVENLCNKLEVKFIEQRYDVRKIAKEEKTSEEEAGRNLRYTLFHQIKEKFSYNKIAVAHNKGDQVETILFNLCRGAGVVGLKGIEPVSGDIIRPLLFCSRQGIEDYLTLNEVQWCTDSTNLTNIYMRNKIRHELIPFLEREVNPMSVENIWAAGNHLKEVNDYITKQYQVAYNKIVLLKNNKIYIPIEELEKEDILIRKFIIRKSIEVLSLGLKDITAKHVNNVLGLVDNMVGKYTMLPYEIRGTRDYENLVIEKWNKKEQEEFKPILIEMENVYEFYLNDKKEILNVNLEIPDEMNNLKEYEKKQQNGYTKCFDYDKIQGKLLLRTRRDGDFLEINENGGRKKLKRFFIDNKIPQNQRDKILLLTDDNHVIWVVGYRISEGYKITKNTSRIMKVQLDGGK